MTQAQKNKNLKIIQNWAQEENIPLAIRKETEEPFKGTYTIDYDGVGIVYNLSKGDIHPAYAGLYNFIISIREKFIKL